MKTSEKGAPYLLKRIKEMLYGLYATFFAGMFINLFSGDEDGMKKPWYAHLGLSIHVFIAIVLMIGATIILKISLKNREASWSKFGIYGFASIVLSIVGGFLAIGLPEIGGELGSFLMAIAFISACASYGMLYYKLSHVSLAIK